MRTNRIKLDWKHLMGFNQVKAAKSKSTAAIASKLGAKVGGKPVEAKG